ncbi:MAG: phosphatase PAP2 family protein [Candidatus Lokiarchaeota archaeon]|nr:phosphatase PAP2 family protein [Candidatus Lokiarchaeota archaeon]
MLENLKKSFTMKLILIIVIVWIILALVFGFTDLEISIAVVDESSEWGIFGRGYGEVPGYGLIAIALSALIGSYNKDIKKQKIPAYVILAIGIILFILGIIDNSQDLILDGGSISICLIAFLAITFNKDWKKYQKISAVIIILAVINPLIFVQITKILSGRIRFRDLIVPGYTDYTPWFLPPGPTSSGRSFPSGHTAMGFMFLPLLILVKGRKLKDPIRIILTILVLGWAIFVGLSRIVIGAHYASDVLFSAMMASVITVLLYRKYFIEKS